MQMTEIDVNRMHVLYFKNSIASCHVVWNLGWFRRIFYVAQPLGVWLIYLHRSMDHMIVNMFLFVFLLELCMCSIRR